MLLNGEELETVDWTMHDHVILLHSKPGMNQIDILVENCGRVNYADFNSDLLNNQRKGHVVPCCTVVVKEVTVMRHVVPCCTVVSGVTAY